MPAENCYYIQLVYFDTVNLTKDLNSKFDLF